MFHEPASQSKPDNAIPKKTKLGIRLFFIYLFVYAGFVAIGTIVPKYMGKEVIGGQNLAIIYGMGLIVLAIIMGLIYNYYCTKYEKQLNKEDN